MATAVALIGTAITLYAANQQAEDADEQAKAQSEAIQTQAQAATTANALNTANLQSQQQQAEGSAIAALGAAGVDPNTGSGLADQDTTAQNYARQIYADNFSTANTVGALNTSAANSIIQGNELANTAIWSGLSSVAKSGAVNSLYSSSQPTDVDNGTDYGSETNYGAGGSTNESAGNLF